jgi:hypothetical protein
MGIPAREHVTSLGLTEDEIAQVACAADTTGGLAMSIRWGAKLAEALLRTAAPAVTDHHPDGTAQLNLTIRVDVADRPDVEQFAAANAGSGETVSLDALDCTQAGYLHVTPAEGNYLLVADAGDLRRGEMEVSKPAGDDPTISVPFRALMPTVDNPPPVGAFRLGANGLILSDWCKKVWRRAAGTSFSRCCPSVRNRPSTGTSNISPKAPVKMVMSASFAAPTCRVTMKLSMSSTDRTKRKLGYTGSGAARAMRPAISL